MSAHGITDVGVLLKPLEKAEVALRGMQFIPGENIASDIRLIEYAQKFVTEVSSSLRSILTEEQVVQAEARILRAAGTDPWSSFDPTTWTWKIQPTCTFERDMLFASLDEFRATMKDLMGSSKKRTADVMLNLGADQDDPASALLFAAQSQLAGLGDAQAKMQRLDLGPEELRKHQDLKNNVDSVLQGGVPGSAMRTAPGMTTQDSILAMFETDSPANVMTLENGQCVIRPKKLTDEQNTYFRWQRNIDNMKAAVPNGDPLKETIQGFRVTIEMLVQIHKWPAVKTFLTKLTELRKCGMVISLDPLNIQTLFHTFYLQSYNIDSRGKDPIGKGTKKGPKHFVEDSMYTTCREKKICFQFNSEKCSRAKCNFKHVCSQCGGAHPAAKCTNK